MGVQTAKEALLAEVLADQVKLIDRLEKLEKSLPVMVKTISDELRQSGQSTAEKIVIAGNKSKEAMREDFESMEKTLSKAADSIETSACTLSSLMLKITLLALFLGLCAGFIGGAIIAGIV